MTWRLLPVAVALGLSVGGGCHPGWLGMRQRPSFPDAASGWTAVSEMQTFGRRTLYDYMDGAGEHYLAYDFRRIYVREYGRADAPRIVAEAYAMTTSADAFGVFSHDTTGEDVGIGQGCAYGMGLLRFWKGAWFVRILAEQETPEAKRAVLAIGRALAAPIEEGPLPPILEQLPREGLEPSGIRYFHTPFSLSTIYYLADDNILDLSSRAEAVFADYRRGGDKLHLLLVRYRNAEQAQAACREFARAYLKDKAPLAPGARRVVPVEEGRFAGVLHQGSHVAIVLEAGTQAACARLLGDAAQAIE